MLIVSRLQPLTELFYKIDNRELLAETIASWLFNRISFYGDGFKFAPLLIPAVIRLSVFILVKAIFDFAIGWHFTWI